MHGGNAVLCSHSPVFFTNIGQTMSLLLTRRADLVAMPGGPHPIPSRTRPLSPPGPMVLRLKAWESRSLPGLPGACAIAPYDDQKGSLLCEGRIASKPWWAETCAAENKQSLLIRSRGRFVRPKAVNRRPVAAGLSSLPY